MAFFGSTLGALRVGFLILHGRVETSIFGNSNTAAGALNKKCNRVIGGPECNFLFSFPTLGVWLLDS